MCSRYKILLTLVFSTFLAACHHDDGVNNTNHLLGDFTGPEEELENTWLIDGIQITLGQKELTDDGFVHKRVGVSVTGNGGQAAPDGTLVRLRAIDSVIAYGEDGSIRRGSNQFASENPIEGTFNGRITRQFEPLYADGAQVLLLTGSFRSRGRVANAITGPNSLDVDFDYQESRNDLRYWVGKSHYGISVLDRDESVLPDGVATTVGGKASVIVRYPRYDCVTGDGDCMSILGYGCGSYGRNGEFFPEMTFLRQDQAYSEQVLLFAEIGSNLSPDSPRHVAVSPDFCFRPPAG